MGYFRVEVQAVGGHGCQRTVKGGEQLQQFCGNPSCPDCAAREFVRQLKRIGAYFDGTENCKATLTHWPGQETQVVDDLLTGTRKGNF